MTNKLIFLDFDGVLHELPNIVPRDWQQIMSTDCYFRPEQVARIKQLCDETGARIVVSSAWRYDFCIEQFNQVLGGLVIGITPHLNLSLPEYSKGGVRLREVLNYLQQENLSDCRWIAIDDQAKHYPDIENAIITDASVGFSVLDLEKGLELLR